MDGIGVCYGMLGDNLPQPREAVSLIQSTNSGIIKRVRLYYPEPNALNALRNSGLQILLDVPNTDLQSLASDSSAAANWVQTNIQPYMPGTAFKYLAVGNEVIPGPLAQYVLPAMKNLYAALTSAGYSNQISVSTSVSTGVLSQSYPPSTGAFSSDALQYLQPIVQFLINTSAPFLANVYPYFSYAGNSGQISIQYALFTSPGTVVWDGQLTYQNLFDAILDAVYSALEKIGGANVPVVVSESGWPSSGGFAATIQNAQTYNSNLIRHVAKGTPKRNGHIEAYIFALFNEDLKTPPGTENNFGLFYPNKQPVYQILSNTSSIGVCYGMLGDNLPQPNDVVNLIKSTGIIGGVRLYGPDPNALKALSGSNLQLLLDVPNSDLQSLASGSSAAATWVQNNIQPYLPGVSFKYLAVGNEVIPGWQAQYVFPAMQNVYGALSAVGLQNQISVSTSVSTGVLGKSFPPSAGEFSSDALQYLKPIVQFLVNTGSPFLANVYPYFSYAGNPGQISLQYALFNSPGTVVQDGKLAYQNLFDAMVDSLYSSLERIGGANVPIVISESGWPSDGGFAATIDNARVFNTNLVKHAAQGTPKRAGKPIETYIFALFNEDLKQPHGTENNFGLFYPSKQPVYPFH